MHSRLVIVGLALLFGLYVYVLPPAARNAASADAAADSVVMVAPDGDGSSYWPRWRGPSGQGLVEGTGYPDTWSDTHNVQWRTAVPGRGHSSPIVWNDRIFLTTAYDDGRVAVLSFRRSDGELLWQAFGPDTTPEHIHRKNSHASATPSTDGRLVYASFGNKGLLAVDFDGKVAWHRSVGTIDNYHGSAGSPLLYRDRLILYQDQRGDGAFIAAFDAATGRTLWRTPRQGTVGWGTPVAVQVGDEVEIIVSGQQRVQGYDPETGAELWKAEGNTREVIPTPVVGHGLVFCASGRAGPTLAIRPGGRGDVTDTHIVWRSPRGSPFVPSPLVYGDHLYTINDMASIATSFKAATGEMMWQGRLGEARREGFSASPVGVDGKVFFTNDYGETFVLKAGPAFNLLHVNRLNARTLASPALLDGRWYFRTEQELLAIGH
jgi:outer membrane protein assembly factor BamB